MKNSLLRVLTVLLSAACLPIAPAWSHDGGFYLGGSLGHAEHRDACRNVDIPCDENDTGWKIFAGYQFNRYVAAELGYADLGAATARGRQAFDVNSSFEVTAWELVAVGAFPVMDRLSLYGKLGIFRGEVKNEASAVGPGFTDSTSAKENNTDLTFGFGLRFDVARNLSARVEWQRYPEVGGGELVTVDVDVFSLGLLYRF